MNSKKDISALNLNFFDDLAKPVHIWQKPSLLDSFKPGICNTFYKKNSKLNNFKTRFYTLSKELLYYRKVNLFKDISKRILFYL